MLIKLNATLFFVDTNATTNDTTKLQEKFQLTKCIMLNFDLTFIKKY